MVQGYLRTVIREGRTGVCTENREGGTGVRIVIIGVTLIINCNSVFCQEDLDSMCRVWNAHQIRPTKNQNCPNGRPVVMYSVPSLYNTYSYLHGVEEQKIAACEEECRFRADTTCDEDFADLCRIYMAENDWQFPGLLADGIQLYKDLRRTINRDLNMD